jgi:hypothetical protein
MRSPNAGQSTLEYFILSAVVLIALVASGVLGKIKVAFQGYFSQASKAILTSK